MRFAILLQAGPALPQREVAEPIPALIELAVSTGVGELLVVAMAAGDALIPPVMEFVTGADFASMALTPTGSPRAAARVEPSCAQAPATRAAMANET